MPNCALVTGAAKRIGREIALLLAGRGYDIALHYNASEPDARSAADEVRALGRRCALLQADLADMDQVAGLLSQALDQLGPCDLLVNNASIFERCRFLDTTPDLFDRHFNINFKAAFFLARDFARRASAGHIINLLDTNITRDASPYFAYTLTKKALADFTRMAAAELAPNFRVNGVCPGPMLPPPGQAQEYLDKLARLVPLGRVGRPSQIAAAVAFLLDNDFITGQCLFVDGGQHLR